MDYKDFLSTGQKNLSFWHKARLNLILYLFKNTFGNYNKNRKILDIGCGTGTELKILSRFGQVTALDINEQALELAKQNNCQIILADIEKYDLDNNYYDAVCCFDILEHLENDQRAIKNIFNSLKSKGYFFFTVPACQFLFSNHDIALGHQRRYSKKGILLKLEKAGFKIIKINYWFFLLFPIALTVRIIKIIFTKLNKNNIYKPDMKNHNKYIEQILFYILNLENKLISRDVNLPFGLTIYGIAKK